MLSHPAAPSAPVVALLAEGVDRNVNFYDGGRHGRGVALLAEGVDRNTSINDAGQETARVALLAEGVDRNVY